MCSKHLKGRVPDDSQPKRGLCVDFQRKGAKIVLYLVSLGFSFIVDAGGENFVFWLYKIEDNCLPRRVLKEFCFCATNVSFLQQKSGGPWPTRPPVAGYCAQY